jgi:MFS family permease
MAVVGLGLGMIMQVVVLAAQNCSPVEHMGTATSTATFFRSIGGSIGVSVLGTVFASRLHAELATRIPETKPGAVAFDAEEASPERIRMLEPATRSVFEHAFAAALHHVFLYGAAITCVAFLLALVLREVPLRDRHLPSPVAE